jgi:hypothetical protein
MSRESAGKALKILTAQYDKLKQLVTETTDETSPTAELYLWGLADIDEEVLGEAVKRLIREGKFYPYPTVADVREWAETVCPQMLWDGWLPVAENGPALEGADARPVLE